jgi:hypothetical protein
MSNEGKSVASFCHHVAALVPAMFCIFYIVKNNKIADNSATTEARENFFCASLTKFENYQMFLNKIYHRFLVTTKLFSVQKSLIHTGVEK